jgi:hypothetical protein
MVGRRDRILKRNKTRLNEAGIAEKEIKNREKTEEEIDRKRNRD